MKADDKTPPPGSEAALDLGCLCPVMDNNYGRGFSLVGGEPQYWHGANCPLHGCKKDDKKG